MIVLLPGDAFQVASRMDDTTLPWAMINKVVGSGFEVLDMGTRIPKWAYAITKFLTIGELLVKKEEAMKVKNKVAMFILLNGTLYKRGFSLPLLRCISPNEDQYVMA